MQIKERSKIDNKIIGKDIKGKPVYDVDDVVGFDSKGKPIFKNAPKNIIAPRFDDIFEGMEQPSKKMPDTDLEPKDFPSKHPVHTQPKKVMPAQDETIEAETSPLETQDIPEKEEILQPDPEEKPKKAKKIREKAVKPAKTAKEKPAKTAKEKLKIKIKKPKSSTEDIDISAPEFNEPEHNYATPYSPSKDLEIDENGFVITSEKKNKESTRHKEKDKPKKEIKIKDSLIWKKKPEEKSKPEPKTKIVKKKEPVIQHKFSQDWVPFDHTVTTQPYPLPIVKLKDGRYIAILEIAPINFSFRTPEEKASIIASYQAWLKIAPRKLQFLIRSEPTEVTGVVETLTKMNENDEALAVERRNELIQHVKDLSSSSTSAKKFYVIFPYEPPEGEPYSKDEDEIIAQLGQQIQTTIYSFGQIGNAVKVHREPENYEVANLFYKLLNPKSSKTESLYDRIDRIRTDEMLCHPDDYSIEQLHEDSFVAPRGLDFTHPRYVIKDGMYEGYLYIRSDGYNSQVGPEWLDAFINFGDNVTFNIYCEKGDREKIIAEAKHSAMMSRIKSNEKAGKVEQADELINNFQNADLIKKYMQEYRQDLYDVEMLLTITESTWPRLKKAMAGIKASLKAYDWIVEDCTLHNEEACKMSLPCLYISPEIKQRAVRNFLSSSLASTYDYSAYEMYDDEGIVMGINGQNATLVAPNPFSGDRKKFPNANMVILGQSGMGKTFFLMTLAYSMRLSGKTVYVILPEKGHEWAAMTRAIGGSYIELAPGSKDCINILEIRPQKDVDVTFTDEADIDSGSLLAKKIQQVITFMQLNMTRDEMTDEEENELSTALTHLYLVYKITDNNDSIWEDKEAGILKKMPTFSDLYKICASNAVLSERLLSILNPYVFGNCKNLDKQTNVDLDNKFVVISTTRAQAKMAPFSFIAVDCAYDAVKADTFTHKALIMDEVWKMMINPSAAKYVMEIYKIIRGYGGAAISATQDIKDLKEVKEGAEMLSNAKTKFFLGMEREAIAELDSTAVLTEDDKSRILGFSRGQALMFCGGDRISLVIQAPKEWHALFNTDAASKRRQMQEKAEQEAQLEAQQEAQETE